MQWELDDYGRRAFDSLVRLCPGGATASIETCIQIFAQHTHADRPPELRLAMMTLAETVSQALLAFPRANCGRLIFVHLAQWIEDVCHSSEFIAQFEEHSSDVLRSILMPSLAWKPGRVEATLRKVGLAGLLAALKSKLISAGSIQEARYEVKQASNVDYPYFSFLFFMPKLTLFLCVGLLDASWSRCSKPAWMTTMHRREAWHAGV